MSIAVASIRRPTALLTRSVVFNRTSNQMSSSVRRSLDPSRIATKSFYSSARASATSSSSAIPHISLHIAASSSGKGRKFQPEQNTYDYIPSNTDGLGLQKGANLQERRKGRPDSGQDAYFVARVGQDSGSTAFAIADGVGGWTERGVDPADFSHGLCSYMAQHALSWSDPKALSPKQLLNLGYEGVVEDPEILAGGTTACVGVTDETGRMRIANLGDSGFVQLRLGKVHHYSDPQTHAFNTPFQMSLTPPDILRQAKVFGGIPLSDKPDDADLQDHMLRHGDVVVLATDGVWDNLDAQDVLKVVSAIMRRTGAWELTTDQGYAVGDKVHALIQADQAKQMSLNGTLQATIAAAIVGEAKSASQSQKRDGPFAKAVRKEYPGESWSGGKVDDIAVLVIVPVDSSKKQLKAKL